MPAGHENPLDPGVWKKVLFQRDELTPGRIQMINWARLPVGRHFLAHYHEDMQEVFIVMSGEAEITVGDETVALGRGDSIVIEPREVHSMSNHGQVDMEYLALGITERQGGRTIQVEPI